MSSIFGRIPLIKHMFRGNDAVASEHARRWRRAFADFPELASDVIRLGGILKMLPERLVEGASQPDQIDPLRMAYENGQRDLALKLLALGGISIHDLNQLMENTDV